MTDHAGSPPIVGGDRSRLWLRPRRRGEALVSGAGRAPVLAGPATAGTFLLHADLHNHSDLSDGFGRADDAFAAMRDAGLDAAALTDHAGLSDRTGTLVSELVAQLRTVSADAGGPAALIGDAEYARALELADAADDPGAFTAIRGFEWTTPHLGHVNVWFAPEWTPVTDVSPQQGMAVLRDWIARVGGGPGGADLLAGFNHPGREPLRFDGFAYDARLHDRMVSLEMFNRDRDYLFEGVAHGRPSPLVECLRAGWWPGLAGVSDEHTPLWGVQPGRGRTGLWLREWSRRGVHEALRSRAMFATREAGLRVDVVAAWAGQDRPDVPAPAEVALAAGAVRMGGRLAPAAVRGVATPSADLAVDLAVDVDGGPQWTGRDLVVQVLTTGDIVPGVVCEHPVVSGRPTTVRVPVRSDGSTPWLVVRIGIPEAPNERPGPPGHPANIRGLAYTSPIGLPS